MKKMAMVIAVIFIFASFIAYAAANDRGYQNPFHFFKDFFHHIKVIPGPLDLQGLPVLQGSRGPRGQLDRKGHRGR
jgi:hypothetical protein